MWGRENNPDYEYRLGVVGLFLLCPFLVYWMTIQVYVPSKAYTMYISDGLSLYISWILFQAFLMWIPDMLGSLLWRYRGGKQHGHISPSGNTPQYNVNGLQAWILTALIGLLLKQNVIRLAWLADHWIPMYFVCNIVGLTVTFGAYIKASLWPSSLQDNCRSRYFLYDIIMGVELHPRIMSWDLKLLFNGRVGMMLWLLVDASFASRQYETFGRISNNMWALLALHALYVLDFFWNETWYLKTIDIAHDHFGWMLAWGDCVWLPYTYTIQAVYLSQNGDDVDNIYLFGVMVLGLTGYALFRNANHQKDSFKRGEWTDASHIKCEYYTKSESTITKHEGRLLCDGLWRYARHINYTGDIMLALAFSLVTASTNIVVYFYPIYMLILLVIRCSRDEGKCSKKYEAGWEMYTTMVPHRLVPGVY